MESLLAYIVQVNILLAMIYGGYILLLKNLTFYQLNRVYFLCGAFFAFSYPFLDIKSLFQGHIEPVGELIGFLPDFYLVEEESIYTLENLLYLIIVVGIVTLVVKFLMQLASLFRIHIHSVDATWQKYLYRNVLFPVVPFSFLNKIYVSKQQHAEPELHDIFEHETIHVKGLHSVDIIVFEMMLIACWYNPFVWLMRSAIRQNLEFLTDQQVLNKGVDRQTYQYSLLNVSKQGAAVGISNQFNFKLLKKRIMMMNKKRSSKLELSKYAFLLPIIIFSAGAFTVSKADPAITGAVKVVQEITLEELDVPNVLGLKKDSPLIDTVANQNHAWQLEDTVEFGETESMKINVLPKDKPIKLDVLSDTTRTTKSLLFIPSNVKSAPPLVYVDGKEMGVGYSINEINPNDIHSVEVIKDAQAIISNGMEGKNGIIKIFTKEAVKNGTVDVSTINVRMTKADTTKTKKPEAVVIRGKKIGAGEVNGLTFKNGKSPGNEPLLVVDGKIPADQTLKHLDPNNIENVTILRGTSATAIYGTKGTDGAVLVTTKVGKGTSNKQPYQDFYTDDDVFFIDGKAVSKNEFSTFREANKGKVETSGGANKVGRRFEITTK